MFAVTLKKYQVQTLRYMPGHGGDVTDKSLLSYDHLVGFLKSMHIGIELNSSPIGRLLILIPLTR